MVNFEVRSKKQASLFQSEKPWAAISISSYENEWPTLSTHQRLSVLQLAFKDVEFAGRAGGLNSDGAKLILEFFDEYHDKIDTLLVHCEFGASRSPAVAAAISKIWYGKDQYFFDEFTPNMLVYRTVLNEALANERWGRMLQENAKR